MHNSQLIFLIKGLNPHELNLLHHFINTNCPNKKKFYHQSNPSISTHKVNKLFCILKEEYPDFKQENIQKKIVYEKLYPDEEYNDKKMRNIIHELFMVIEFYLTHIDCLQDKGHCKMHLINQLEKRNLLKLYELKINATDNYTDNYDSRNEDYYFQKFLLTEKKRVLNENKIPIGKNDIIYNLLKNEMDYFTNYFLTIVYKQLSLATFYKDYMNVDIDTSLYNHIINYLNEEKTLINSNKTLFIWNKFLKLYGDKISKNKIAELKKLLDENQSHFKKLDYQYLYTDLLNFTIKQYTINEAVYKEPLMYLLKDIIRKNIYIRNGFIHYHNYTILIYWMLKMDEIELAEEFILHFKKFLLSEYRESVYSYNYAHFYYKTKKYDKALEMLSTVKCPDYFFRFGINELMLKIYFELKNYVNASNIFYSYKHYLQNNKTIPVNIKSGREMFLKYYKDLLKLKSSVNRNEAEQLIKKIQKENDISSKDWFISKLKLMEIVAE